MRDSKLMNANEFIVCISPGCLKKTDIKKRLLKKRDFERFVSVQKQNLFVFVPLSPATIKHFLPRQRVRCFS